MGQQMDYMPQTWPELMEEKDRVLRWSGEVLARVDDNITNEDAFLMDYDTSKIDRKIDEWISFNKNRINEMCSKIPNLNEGYKSLINSSVEKIKDEIGTKMRKDYQMAYKDLEKFTKKVDILGADQRKIHSELQLIEEKVANDVKKFQKQFAPLRHRAFNNLRCGEKMLFEDQKLKAEFTRKISDVDNKNLAECCKRFEKLLADLQKQAVN